MTTIAHGQYPQKRPNGLWRGSSAMVMGLTGSLSKLFLYGGNRVEVVGLDEFVKLLESRTDPYERQRGLITVSNHMSVIDDPTIWGVLPMSTIFSPWNLRWGLGAHDICFKNKLLATYFTIGQVLPIHRSIHSPHAGLFQPSMTQAIRLLSAFPFKSTTEHNSEQQPKTASAVETLIRDLRDPFTEGSLTYSTDGRDVHTAPSAFLSNRHAWVHVFPEGLVHQHPERQMRYFRWGVSRLILEAEPMPDLVPMFIDGTCEVMNENRGWPRFVPRAGRDVKIAFGERVDMEKTFGDLRTRWKALVKSAAEKRAAEIKAEERRKEEEARNSAPRVSEKDIQAGKQAGRHGLVAATATAPGKLGSKKLGPLTVGELPEELRSSEEARAIRIEVAKRVRDEVLKLRSSLGYPDEDPALKLGLAETWAREPKTTKKSPVDGSTEKPAT